MAWKLDLAGIPETWFEAHQEASGEYVEPEKGRICYHEPRCQTIWDHVNATIAAKHAMKEAAETELSTTRAALEAAKAELRSSAVRLHEDSSNQEHFCDFEECFHNYCFGARDALQKLDALPATQAPEASSERTEG